MACATQIVMSGDASSDDSGQTAQYEHVLVFFTSDVKNKILISCACKAMQEPCLYSTHMLFKNDHRLLLFLH